MKYDNSSHVATVRAACMMLREAVAGRTRVKTLRDLAGGSGRGKPLPSTGSAHGAPLPPEWQRPHQAAAPLPRAVMTVEQAAGPARPQPQEGLLDEPSHLTECHNVTSTPDFS